MGAGRKGSLVERKGKSVLQRGKNPLPLDKRRLQPRRWQVVCVFRIPESPAYGQARTGAIPECACLDKRQAIA